MTEALAGRGPTPILDAAIAWHVRCDTMNDADWHDFIAWLEADPMHADAYDVVSLADARRHPVSRVLPVAANDTAPVRRPRWPWLAGGSIAAAAAAAALLVVGPPSGVSGARGYSVTATGPRVVAMQDGTRIEMQPGARLTLDRGDRRYASLDAGRATFRVRHDANHPFTLHAGPWDIRDVGTVFEVDRTDSAIDVAVSEGAVMVAADNRETLVTAGHRVRAVAGMTAPLKVVDLTTVAPPRELVFSAQPMRSVVTAMGSAIGVTVQLEPSLADRPFTGIVRFTGDPTRDVPHFAALTGTRWTRDGDIWLITPASATAQ
jgi:transmembrane sensor